MKRLYNILSIIAFLPLLHGCVGNGGQEPGTEDPVPITLSTGIENLSAEAGSETRAPNYEGTFPNGGSIGVLISMDTDPASDPAAIDWTQDYILEDPVRNPGIGGYGDAIPANSEAISNKRTGSQYGFGWKVDGNYYWPFDGTSLRFMAYAPHMETVASQEQKCFISADFKVINIELDGCGPNTPSTTPDIMYVDPPKRNGTTKAETKVYNKVDKTADLGTFKHALSQLTIEIVNAANESVKLIGLTVTAGKTIAALNLTEEDDGVKLEIPSLGHQSVTYSFVDPAGTGVDIKTNNVKKLTYGPVLLLPATGSDVSIKFELKDGPYESVEYVRSLTDFLDTGNNPITLKRGMTTTATITIKGTNPTIEPARIDLTGKLSKWIDAGDIDLGIIK